MDAAQRDAEMARWSAVAEVEKRGVRRHASWASPVGPSQAVAGCGRTLPTAPVWSAPLFWPLPPQEQLFTAAEGGALDELTALLGRPNRADFINWHNPASVSRSPTALPLCSTTVWRMRSCACLA